MKTIDTLCPLDTVDIMGVIDVLWDEQGSIMSNGHNEYNGRNARIAFSVPNGRNMSIVFIVHNVRTLSVHWTQWVSDYSIGGPLSLCPLCPMNTICPLCSLCTLDTMGLRIFHKRSIMSIVSNGHNVSIVFIVSNGHPLCPLDTNGHHRQFI